MEIAEHIEALRRDGTLLAEAAGRVDLDTPIPTAPEWNMRQLVQHIGDVHRWAATHVAEQRMKRIDRVEEIAGPLPEDSDLLDWFHQGHEFLIETLEKAGPDVQCYTFLPAPSPLAFWARRQAHETGMHRADAESPGGRITPFPSDLAVDGVEEMLFGFLSRRPDDEVGEPVGTVHLQAIDTGNDWLIAMDTKGAQTVREPGEADCVVLATASDLHLLLWNRRSPENLDVAGDRSPLDYWRENVQITWGRPRS
jgi:uncharacterized protein (TIGR03083 family)